MSVRDWLILVPTLVVTVAFFVALVKYRPARPPEMRADYQRLATAAERVAEGLREMQPALEQVGQAMHKAGEALQAHYPLSKNQKGKPHA